MTSFENAVGRAVDRLGPDRLRAIAAGIQTGSSLTALCSADSMAGYTDTVRAIVLSQDGLPDQASTRGAPLWWHRIGQDQDTAAYFGMPGVAIATGLVPAVSLARPGHRRTPHGPWVVLTPLSCSV